MQSQICNPHRTSPADRDTEEIEFLISKISEMIATEFEK